RCLQDAPPAAQELQIGVGPETREHQLELQRRADSKLVEVLSVDGPHEVAVGKGASSRQAAKIPRQREGIAGVIRDLDRREKRPALQAFQARVSPATEATRAISRHRLILFYLCHIDLHTRDMSVISLLANAMKTWRQSAHPAPQARTWPHFWHAL